MRDGVNLSPHKKFQPLVPFSDLMKLSNLVAYLRLPRDLPLTILTFDYHALPIHNLAFVRKAHTNTTETSPIPSPDSAPLSVQATHAHVDTHAQEPSSDDVRALEEVCNPYEPDHGHAKELSRTSP